LVPKKGPEDGRALSRGKDPGGFSWQKPGTGGHTKGAGTSGKRAGSWKKEP